ncbi:MAG: rhomboid family intramembrane serine protease [Acidobacteriia bacterium]|nr:rhomboid family intramembrane serine protease [Terriglobia bacterium]
MPRPRNRYPTSSYMGYVPRGVKWLLIINTVVFLICYLGGPGLQRHVTLLLALSPEFAIRSFLVWQIFTYMFVHYATLHILFNMLGLWFFGVPLERTWGMRRFLKFYLLCGLVAGICVLAANVIVGQWQIFTIGASGAVMGVMVAFAVLFPEAIILMFFVFPMQARYAVMIFVAMDLLATFGQNTGVSTVAHLGGAAFGYLYLKGRIPVLNMPDIRGAYRQWKLQRAKKKFQVYMRKHGKGPWVN